MKQNWCYLERPTPPPLYSCGCQLSLTTRWKDAKKDVVTIAVIVVWLPSLLLLSSLHQCRSTNTGHAPPPLSMAHDDTPRVFPH